MFETAYPEIANGRIIGFTDISNVIATFIGFEWRSDQSAFDKHLRGIEALNGIAATGASLFYGNAGCSECHSGIFQTDHAFHAAGVAQVGPGKSASFEDYAGDKGRQRVTGKDADLFAFRTPSLRNVTATGPYGHDGAYRDLEIFVKAHLNPVAALKTYDRSQVLFPVFPGQADWDALDNSTDVAAISAAVEMVSNALNDKEINAILVFLAALDDPEVMKGRTGVPASVPSGLPVDR
ncbi:MAG: cytochrome-c peroxidase [Paracoccaceae bacterium]